MRLSFPIPLFIFGVFLLAGCAGRQGDPAAPVDFAPEACCSVGDLEAQEFAGCRVTGRCRQDERYWLRGAVTCGPVDAGECAGGRCCHYATHGQEDAAGANAEAPTPDENLASDATPLNDDEDESSPPTDELASVED